ncbi:MAG: hypothetical protein JRE65_06255 [Deltaproteobacteria bacterium]|jgi:hypothetical protein|nr:hypothetical protein [Deltaproteobacteria bacterium]
MHSRRIGFIAFLLLVIAMITAGCRITSPKIDQASIENPLFLQNNIHAQVGSRDTRRVMPFGQILAPTILSPP